MRKIIVSLQDKLIKHFLKSVVLQTVVRRSLGFCDLQMMFQSQPL